MKKPSKPGAVDPKASTTIEIPPVKYGTKKPYSIDSGFLLAIDKEVRESLVC